MRVHRLLAGFLVATLAGCMGGAPTPNRADEPAPAAVQEVPPDGTFTHVATDPAPPPSPPDDAPNAPTPPENAPWLVTEGTSTLGFGILRLAPGPGRETATFDITFSDYGDGGYSSDASSACLIVLPGDVFERSDAAWAGSWMGFGVETSAATPPAKDQPEDSYDRVYDEDVEPLQVTTRVTVGRDRTVLVAYGPWDGADVGRPPSNQHTFTLTVEEKDGGNYRWVESEAGEMVTTNWTRRPGVSRGDPWVDPESGKRLWIETRILVLYDPVHAGPAGVDDPSDPDGERLRLRPALYQVLAKVPIRWR